ncbi:MAG: hypothetical protein ACRD8O_05045 [Bryobacteraceae bacterium]
MIRGTWPVSLDATEVMAHYRMSKMGAGLDRLGFDASETEFATVLVLRVTTT